MTFRFPAKTCIIVFTLCISGQLQAAIPVCTTKDADLDGNGYGWENNQSCQIRDDQSTALKVLHPSAADNVISITWPPIDDKNPFASPPLNYEVWNNDALLAIVDTNHFLIKISELENNIGCIRIRAVRGSYKSDRSSPACFVIQS